VAERFDVIVVGGGPGGSSAARQLAWSGLSVVLLDKARFPRDKLCGGLISERSTKLLEHIFGDAIAPTYEHVSTGARLFYDTEPITHVKDYKTLRLTMRRTFDHALLNAARASGVDVREGIAVTAIAEDRRAVTLSTGEVLRADFIVGADGAASRVRKSVLPAAMDKHGFATGVEIEIPRALLRRECPDPEIYLGCIRWGYGWIFPKRETFTVGIAGLANKNDDIRGACRAFMQQVLGFVPQETLPGHPIPFGNHLKEPGVGNVLLVGDAAGFAEPITGEGIAFAMQSGAYAAEAIIETHKLASPNRAAERYIFRCQPLIQLFDDACLFRYLTFSQATQRHFAKLLQVSGNATKRYLDIVAADSDYRTFLRYLIKTALTRFPKIVATLSRDGFRKI
jgi:menaquinone-9 beta-reductase